MMPDSLAHHRQRALAAVAAPVQHLLLGKIRRLN